MTIFVAVVIALVYLGIGLGSVVYGIDKIKNNPKKQPPFFGISVLAFGVLMVVGAVLLPKQIAETDRHETLCEQYQGEYRDGDCYEPAPKKEIPNW